ncbi:type I pullulanase [Paenibacillus sp. J22TS3]|uniref:type I pullulanase n=1 Tax=Paenibacillus sp. J22TS3 TaxID=2807192 RepID=UPI001B1AFFAB|nr:type I pullulanase [Paenibacillus sp. J22TS3]GIP23458.1 type I pullulanase [Paenibacillus sp. J22TS3]
MWNENVNQFKLHYYRYDQNLENWNLWVWYDSHEGNSYAWSEIDGDGFATVSIELPAGAVHVIPRMSLSYSDWADQEEPWKIELPAGRGEVEVWLLQGDKNVYFSRGEVDISPRFHAVLADAPDMLTVVASGPVNREEAATLELMDLESRQLVPVETELTGEQKLTVKLIPPGKLDPARLYHVSSRTYRACVVTMRHILDDPLYYYAGNDLGLTYTPSASEFKLWAPTAAKASLVLYSDPGIYNAAGLVNQHEDGRSLRMERSPCGVWSVRVSGNLKGRYYLYRLHFADGTASLAPDPYAKAVTANGQRTAVIDLRSTDPPGWNPQEKPALRQWTDAVIYELHVRDFSTANDSGLVHKGKFKAFTELGASTAGGLPSGVEHLKELGITHVQLLPCSDFATVNELDDEEKGISEQSYNWGYDPQHFNVPEGSYSTNPHDPAARIREFKELVQTLHHQGIGVIMDVVYNHTYSTDEGPFDRIVPGYFYRTTDTGRCTNGTGVGNEMASERPMVRKYILDSIRYWAAEYGIDGFRLDLMGLLDKETVSEAARMLHELDSGILIYGEPWDMSRTPLPQERKTLKGTQRGRGYSVFNDNFRMAIKGDSDGSGAGFATGAPGKEGDIATGVQGSIHTFAASPVETINYVTAHDNLILWDKILITQGLKDELGLLEMQDGKLRNGGSVAEAVNLSEPYWGIGTGEDMMLHEAVRRSILANAIILTSLGIPLIHAGDEMLRTKFGDHNSYKSSDCINQIRWGNKIRFQKVFEYYRGLILLRREHPAFRLSSREAVESHLQILRAEGNIVAFRLGEHAGGDSWRNIVVIYNGNQAACRVLLPAYLGQWNVVVDDRGAGTEVLARLEAASDSVLVSGLSIMVLYDE